VGSVVIVDAEEPVEGLAALLVGEMMAITESAHT